MGAPSMIGPLPNIGYLGQGIRPSPDTSPQATKLSHGQLHLEQRRPRRKMGGAKAHEDRR